MTTHDEALQRCALNAIQRERDRQDEKWGRQRHLADRWLAILAEEFGEACQEVNGAFEAGIHRAGPSQAETNYLHRLYQELSEVAAVSVAWMEQIAEKLLGYEGDPL